MTEATPPLAPPSLTLAEIRSDACNKTLVAFSVVATPGLAISLSRVIEQGWQPLLNVHLVGYAALVAVTWLRKRLSIGIRGGYLVFLLFTLGIAGLLNYGIGTGAIMFFIAASIFSACFFPTPYGFVVVAGGCAITMGIYAARIANLIPPAVEPSLYSMNITSWLGAAMTLTFCACGPMFAMNAINQALEAERKRADDAANARSQFLARMSHELRTPMTGVIGMAELMQSTGLDTRQSTMMERLLRAAQNLLGLLNDVLDFAKVDAGRIVIERAGFRISDIVSEITDLFASEAKTRGLGFEISLQQGIVDSVIGDRFRLGQVLSNLIGNALKFTERGRIVISITQRDGMDGAPLTTFTVTDTGIGISADEMARLFQPFVQADSSTTRKYGGSGLGLVISQNLVKAMGGQLAVTSTPDKGSSFTFAIPMAADRSTTKPQPAPSGARTAKAPAPLLRIPAGLRILVADDDQMMHTLLKLVLEDAQAHIVSAKDGAQAVAAAQADTFDLIMIDMHMPVMDGVAATRTIRATGATTPIIALTADIISDARQSVIAAGANAIVIKPISWPQLEAEINKLAKG